MTINCFLKALPLHLYPSFHGFSPTLPISHPHQLRLLSPYQPPPPRLLLSPPIPALAAPAASSVTLQLLEWPRLCHIVAGFAGTASAKELLKMPDLPISVDESEALIRETEAAIHMLSVLGGALDFGGISTTVVSLCLNRLGRGFTISGQEAVAIATLMQFSESLQRDIKIALEENTSIRNLMKPVLNLVGSMIVDLEITKAIWKVVDADGVVKDSASPELARARNQERTLELRLHEVLNRILRDGGDQHTSQEVSDVDGRLCIVASSDDQRRFPGLLLQSGRGGICYIEPIAAVSLNDSIAEARASILKAEYNALNALTSKLVVYLNNIGLVLDTMIQLDVVVARAKYSLSHGGSRPIFICPDNGSNMTRFDQRECIDDLNSSQSGNQSERILLQLRQAYHPLLLDQHRENVKKIKANARDKVNVAILQTPPPVPIDIHLKNGTKVVVITGPNTGGKTAAMKTLGLAALMAKSGLYVLAADPAYLPWFDNVFADIGDDQSLGQCLSTFSSHMQRIKSIKAECTGQSLVLLDEVGAGTNPDEGAALAMAVLESFAEDGCGGSLLTFATTHHGELKTLKYSDRRFENASAEFDEELLKPTFRLLWGIPGRSNAFNISERLGVSKQILEVARGLQGVANAEVNQVIKDLERAKQEFEDDLAQAELYTMKAKVLYRRLKEAMESIQEQRNLIQLNASSFVYEEARAARSTLNAILRQKQSLKSEANTQTQDEEILGKKRISSYKTPYMETISGKDLDLKVGTLVYVPRLGKEGKVAQLSTDRNEVTVQIGPLQIRLNHNELKQYGKL